MSEYLRLRQICLAAANLAPVISDIQDILGVAVCYRDPNVARYGLQNALMPIGTNFLEVVAPIEKNTAAGRFIERTKGHGGYMAIFQASDPRRRQAHAETMGIRIAHVIDRDTYQSVQLHPRDCRASFIEFGRSTDGDDRMGTWWPAGPDWRDFVRMDQTKRMLGIEIESPKPDDLASHWSRIIETPLTVDNRDPVLVFEECAIRFVHGQTECLGTLVLEMAKPAEALAKAAAKGYSVANNSFHLIGVNFRLM